MAAPDERIKELTSEMRKLNRKMFTLSILEGVKTIGKFYLYMGITIVAAWPLYKLIQLIY